MSAPQEHHHNSLWARYVALMLMAACVAIGPGGGCSGGCFGTNEKGSEGCEGPELGDSGSTTQLTHRIDAPRIWPLVEIYPGATSVSTQHFRVRGIGWNELGWFDDAFDPSRALPAHRIATLTDMQTGEPVPMTMLSLTAEAGLVEFQPTPPLEPNREYVLAFEGCPFMPNVICPDPVRFSTSRHPRVVGLWRVGNTLTIAFSEPMDGKTLGLFAGQLDMMFSEGGPLLSVASDLPLFQFVSSTDSARHSVGPISEKPFWLLLGHEVRSAAGYPLDPGAPGMINSQSFAVPVIPQTLPTCAARNDYPDPCIGPEQSEQDQMRFWAPFVPSFGDIQ